MEALGGDERREKLTPSDFQNKSTKSRKLHHGSDDIVEEHVGLV